MQEPEENTIRYLMRLAYNGTPFHGWQLQPNAKSVQGAIEDCFSKMYGKRIGLLGCGRTDTGVHASDFYAHFEVEELKYEPEKMLHKLNSMLPSEVAIKELFPVSKEFHARFSATSREYKYVISKSKNPFQLSQVWTLYKDLDIPKMLEAGKLLLNYEDFTSFAKLHNDAKTNICDLMSFDIQETEYEIIIYIKANRFLRNMVRAIVGTLAEVGMGKLSLEEFKNIIEIKDRGEASFSAPGDGLFLNTIEYPEHLIQKIEI